MTKKAKPTVHETLFPSFPGFGTDWMETMTQMGNEVMEFVAARIKEDVQAQQELMQAKDFAEVQAVQAKFFQGAMDDYAAEFAKMMEIGTKGTSKTGAHATPV
ncbi:phasin family protein [Yoonia sp. I 8.24]|uniref:phasin family protein n=1 Tax=Yoonia sp. I 8.24 TaxID=1537229 RepID=UPI001EDED9E9|nr:phasin family protein [Yoonia sp. I 8.24]MCG3268536.1 phasin family protein [Yoonia sp. I 8.24]